MAGMDLPPEFQLVQAARFALVVLEAPKNQYNETDTAKWQQFLDNLPRNTQTIGKKPTIHDNIWLIPLQTEMPLLARIFLWAADYRIPLRILFLHEEPDWIKYPPDAPKPDAVAS